MNKGVLSYLYLSALSQTYYLKSTGPEWWSSVVFVPQEVEKYFSPLAERRREHIKHIEVKVFPKQGSSKDEFQ